MKQILKINRFFTIASIAIVIIISLCTTFIAYTFTMPDTTTSVLNESIQTAVKAVENYERSLSTNKYNFTDTLFSKANIAATTLSEKSSEEEIEQLARYLYADSIILTDSDGNCVASYPTELKGTNISDNEDTMAFRKVLKGTSFKSQSEPVKVDNSNAYFLYTCVSRADGKGVAIIGTTVSDYSELLGSEIAADCRDNTIIVTDGEVVSSSFTETENTSLNELGITEDNINSDSFELQVNDKKYICKAQQQNDFTVICLTQENSASNIMSVLLITFVVDMIVLVLYIILVTHLAKKNR